jgi:hypothetical protein
MAGTANSKKFIFYKREVPGQRNNGVNDFSSNKIKIFLTLTSL